MAKGNEAPASATTTSDLFAVRDGGTPAPEPAGTVMPGKADAKPPGPAPLVQSVPSISPPSVRQFGSRPMRPPAHAKAAPVGKGGSEAKEPRKSRFPLLATTLALAAALGGAAGAVGIPALVNLASGPVAAQPVREAVVEADAIKALIAQLSGDVGALKAALEQSGKVTAAQFGKVAERLERAERAQAEPVAKLAKIGETVERLERRAPAPTPPAPAAAPPAPADVTGSVHAPRPPAPEPKPKPPIIDDYVVRKVFDGVALVEGRRGIIEVEPGSTLPGAGRVEEIRRQEGRWVVVTNKGLIVPAR
jgi:hypothetical protein